MRPYGEPNAVGTRDGERTGTRAGALSGALAYDLDVEARKSNQYTGFILKGWKGTQGYTEGATTYGDPSFGEYDFGNYAFGAYDFGAYAFGEYDFAEWADANFEPVTGTEWGEWDALPGENPDDCLRSQNADHITQISNVITPGAVTNGDITDGAITDGDITHGAITDGDITDGLITYGTVASGEVLPSGTALVSVNGKPLS